MSTNTDLPLMEIAQEPRRTGGLKVVVDPGESGWNAYLKPRPSASLFHRAEWNRVFAVYGLPVSRLAAARDGRIVGVLPLVWQRSLLFGSRLVSLPWFDAAGVLADEPDAARLLIEEAEQLAAETGVETLELRQSGPAEWDIPARRDKILMRLRLPGTPEDLWNGLKSKVRNQVRKGEKSGLVVEHGGRPLLDAFYAVYSRNMRDLGSPSHSKLFFEEIYEQFPRETTVYVVWLDGQPVGSGWTMANGGRLEIPWGSSLRRYNRYCVNHLMYWHILQDACQAGFDWFHFGRSSRDSGPYRFKKQWGAEEVPLSWHCLSLKGDADDDPAAPQDSYGWATTIWRRLPLWLTRSLGPRFIARIP